MSEKLGIKETREALAGVNEFAVALCHIFGDGFQWSDVGEIFEKIMNDEVLKNALVEAVKGIQSVPAEIKDIDLQEGLDLAAMQLAYVPRYVKAFQK
jgi:hypothetical protein